MPLTLSRRVPWAVAALLVLPAPSARSAQPTLTKIDLFEAGKGGYGLYRIPGLVATASGTLLAYCEARKTARGDWGTTDILLRRSTDGGKTWSEPASVARVDGPHARNPVAVAQKLGGPDEVAYHNAVAVADRKPNVVHLLFCTQYMRCFYQRSDDDGRTFGKPIEITGTFERFRKDYAWKVLATGPAHGIQLVNGRLLVPVWLSSGTGGHGHRPSVVSTIFSDDGGATWDCGDIVANETDLLRNPNETVAAQLIDGRVMLNIRSESDANRRAVAYSPDGATGWTKPAFDDQLKEPICMASLCRLTSSPPADRNRLLFANPHNLDRAAGVPKPGQSRDRKNLTVKLSYDEGKTWPVARPLDPGVSGYSDLAVGTDGMIHCLHERGGTDGKSATMTKTLTLATFNLEWLSQGKDTLPATHK